MLHIVALSGGKDSTAMALRLAEVNPDTEYTYICTPTGDELPEMAQHWENLECLLGKPLLKIRHKFDLNGLIEEFKAIPNFRQRWCTRMLKIEVAQAFYLKHPGSVAYVGLRADEPERAGIYASIIEQSYPLKKWGWGLKEVTNYLADKGVSIPGRTDCARCYHQTLGEWWALWRDNKHLYLEAEGQEEKYGHTFRSEQRDTWPASLKLMRIEFDKGRVPRGAPVMDDLFGYQKCRVCSL